MAKIQKTSPAAALMLCLLNWFIPGAGFVASRDARRGIALFALINGVFFAGLFYDGYILPPTVNFSSPLDNIVAILTFIVQVCDLGGSALLLLAGQLGSGSFFAGNPGAPLSDLGSFHFLVAGGLNYFATMSLWDILTGHEDEAAPQAKEERKKEPEASARAEAK